MSLSIKLLLIVAVLFPFNALARTPENMANELEQAAKIAVTTLRTKGIYGLINNIEKCYSYPKKLSDQNFQCLYLDVAGKYLDRTASETFNVPQKPFFQDDQFGARIGPVLEKANMDLKGANKYMENVTTVIVKMVDARIQTEAANDGNNNQSSVSLAPPVSSTQSNIIQMPPDEAKFIKIIAAAQKESKAAGNDMKRGGIKAQRDTELCSAMKSIKVTNWIGTVEKIDSNSDGKGVLEVSISDDITLKTWNNSLSDFDSKTLIEPGTPTFTAASEIENGQRVAFSGTFFRGSKGDCLEEGSLTLRGKIQEPEFIFRFYSISAK